MLLRNADLPPLVDAAGAAPRLERRCVLELGRIPAGDEWLWVETRCRGLGARQASQALARAAGIPAQQVRGTGVHDREADCTAWFSLPAAAIEQPGAIVNAGYKRKLKVASVRGAGRAIEASDVVALQWELRLIKTGAALSQARELIDRLRHEGGPSHLAMAVLGGLQYAKWGRILAQGKRLPERVKGRAPAPKRLLSAYRGQLFNRLVDERLAAGMLERTRAGDLLETGRNRVDGRRELEAVRADGAMEERIASGEAAITGPLFGRGMPLADGVIGQREAELVAGLRGGVEAFRALAGVRRALAYRPTAVSLDLHGGDLLVACRLPGDVHIAALEAELVAPRVERGDAR